MQTSDRFRPTTSPHQGQRALMNGRWSLPSGYGVMLESFEPPNRREAASFWHRQRRSP
jgi:hypothetical protein